MSAGQRDSLKAQTTVPSNIELVLQQQQPVTESSLSKWQLPERPC